MDNFTHLFVGATLAGLIAPPKHRRVAMFFGGVLCNAPDLDILLPYADEVARHTEHRGFSHSLLFVPLLALMLWGLMQWWLPWIREHRWRWLFALEAALISHPLLDACNVYGTQLFWPLHTPPVQGSLLFIIDPLFTLPFAVAAIAAWVAVNNPKARAWLGIAAMLGAAYIGWAFFAKSNIERAMQADLAARGRTMAGAKLLVTPMPFTTLLWRIVVMHPTGDYYEGYFTYLGPGGATTLDHYPGFRYLVADIADTPVMKRLDWFTHGFYAADQRDDHIIVIDLRMGAHPDFAFRYEVAERRDGKVVAVSPVRLPWPDASWRRYRAIWERALHPQTGGVVAPVTTPEGH